MNEDEYISIVLFCVNFNCSTYVVNVVAYQVKRITFAMQP